VEDLAGRARHRFEVVEARDDPHDALELAHALGEPVLVTGSLYLLADLEAGR
jgi:folylpolyglutamate synthase/dihydropteroate synthase